MSEASSAPGPEGPIDGLLRRLRSPKAIPWLFALAAAVAAVVLYGQFVFRPDRMLFGTDMVDQAYQLREFGLQEVKSGRGVPLWNPYVYSGLPYLAILPGPVFYPTSLLYLVMPLFRAIGWTFVLHTFLAGAVGYFAGRTFRLSRWASVVCGATFMLTGYVFSLVYGGHDGREFAMILTPLAFALVERGFRARRFRWFLAAGAVVGIQILTPHAQVMYFSSLMLSLFAAWRLWEMYREHGEWAALRKPAVYFVGTFVLGASIGAVQILPTLGMMEHGVRGGGLEGYEFAASWALPPQEITAFLFPDLIGSLQTYWGQNPFKLHTEFIGSLPLALALVAAVARWRDRRVRFFGGAALLGFLFALGSATPVHRVAYEVVPLIDRFRAPAMMLGPVTFFVALLAGIGWQAVLEGRDAPGNGGDAGEEGETTGPEVPWLPVWLLSAPVLLFALAAALGPEATLQWAQQALFPAGWQRQPPGRLAGMLRANGVLVLLVWTSTLAAGQAVQQRRLPRWTLIVPLLLFGAEMWRVDSRFVRTVRPAEEFRADRAVRHIQDESATGERVWPLERSYGPNDLMYYDLSSVTGSQNFRLAWYDRLVGGVEYRNLLRRPVLWELLDLSYVTARSQFEVPLLSQVLQVPRARVYRFTRDPPHAWFPERVIAVQDTARALRQTLALSSHAEAAVVEAERPPPAGKGSARLTGYRPERVELSVTARERGLLVVSEVYHPNWHVRVDGEERPLYRADAALRAVVVPRGEHTVVMEYRSLPYRLGLGLTVFGYAASLLGLGTWVVSAWRSRR